MTKVIDNTIYIPEDSAFLLGAILIAMAVIFLVYCVDRSDYFILIGTFGGFIPFFFGCFLILSCFIPDPPPVFGFAVQNDISPVNYGGEK